jgi:pilus assembly protein Flp/PilA
MKRTVNAVLDAFARFMHNRAGATAIEYTLIASLTSLSIIVGAGMLGTSVKELFNGVADKVTEASKQQP